MMIRIVIDTRGVICRIDDEISQRDLKDNIVMKVLKKKLDGALKPLGFSGDMNCVFFSYAGSGMCDIHSVSIENNSISKSTRRVSQKDFTGETKNMLSEGKVYIVEFVLLNEFRKAAMESGVKIEELLA